MDILNIRLGFAANSSSSHSIIIVPRNEAEAIQDKYHEYAFGWDNFTVKNKKAKMVYLAIWLIESLRNKRVSPEVIRAVIKDWIGDIPLPSTFEEIDLSYYIDHQSILTLPCKFNSNSPHYGFFQELKKFLSKKNVIILGGNDNDEEKDQHPLKKKYDSFVIPSFYERPLNNIVCRYDEEKDYWTIFDQTNGNKIRMTFKEKPQEVNIDKSSAPELVDMKITEYCPFGCDFCYESSTTKGRHASIQNIYRIAHALSELEVFEVALGGGEPTLHPEFKQIIKILREHGMVPNFTTRNIHIFDDFDMLKTVIDNCGAIAVSVQNPKEVEELAAKLMNNCMHGVAQYREKPIKINVHIVLGTMDEFTFRQTINACKTFHLQPTILGYKNYGFGINYKPEPYKDWFVQWMKNVNERGDISVSVDTLVIQEFKEELNDIGISPLLYTDKDGAFSCYIDAVQMTMAACSYTDEKYPFDKDEYDFDLAEKIKNIYAKF